MDFQLSDEQKQLRREIRDFAEREIRDNVMKWDEESKFPAEVVRYFILASHYRSPLDYSDENLRAAKSALDGFYIALRGLEESTIVEGDEFEARFHNVMEDDFNTPKAFAEFSALVTEITKSGFKWKCVKKPTFMQPELKWTAKGVKAGARQEHQR